MLLPSRIATHFGFDGQPDGWMSKRGFFLFSSIFPIALASFLLFVANKVGASGGQGLHVPHAEYWRAPEHLAQATEIIRTALERMGAVLIVFFSFLSWSILRANRRTPPKIDAFSVVLSVMVLLVLSACALGGMSSQFETVPRLASSTTK